MIGKRSILVAFSFLAIGIAAVTSLAMSSDDIDVIEASVPNQQGAVSCGRHCGNSWYHVNVLRPISAVAT